MMLNKARVGRKREECRIQHHRSRFLPPDCLPTVQHNNMHTKLFIPKKAHFLHRTFCTSVQVHKCVHNACSLTHLLHLQHRTNRDSTLFAHFSELAKSVTIWQLCTVLTKFVLKVQVMKILHHLRLKCRKLSFLRQKEQFLALPNSNVNNSVFTKD